MDSRTVGLIAVLATCGIALAFFLSGSSSEPGSELEKTSAPEVIQQTTRANATNRVYAHLPEGVARPGKIFLEGTKRYSQHDEELIIRDFFQDKRDGFFLDVGAADPVQNSTTYYLEKHLGWHGIAVDALPQYGPRWARLRPRSTFVSYAVTDHSGDTMTFYQHAWSEVSSISKEYAARFGGEEKLTPIDVQTITLNDVLDSHGIKKIDHLTMDIEGAELLALAGFDIQRFKPDLVCIEAYSQGKVGAKAIRNFFEGNGYGIVKEYRPNTLANWYFAPIAEIAASN